MSDRFTMAANFKYGLDTRRASLLELPGALITCQNGFVNSGGGVQQRMSFAKQSDSFGALTFGLEVTASGLVTFGSSTPPLAYTLPTGVSYRQCFVPNQNSVAPFNEMTEVVYSCNYNGQAFVLAKYGAVGTFAFYGDVSPMPLVGEVRRNGKVLTIAAGDTGLISLAIELAAILNSFDPSFLAVANTDELGNTAEGVVSLKTNPGVHAGFTPSDSSAGSLAAQLVAQNSPGTSAQSASTSFTITSGTTGDTLAVTGPANSDGTGTASVSGVAPVTWGVTDTATTFASAVVLAINTQTPVTGYTARLDVQSVTKVIVNAPIAWGALANAYHITGTPTGTLVISAAVAGVPFETHVSPNPVNVGALTPTIATAIVTGAQGTLTFTWSYISDNGKFVAFTNGQPTCALQAINTLVGAFVATFQVRVTDSILGSVTAQFSVNVNTLGG